jgi:hypothetical protein
MQKHEVFYVLIPSKQQCVDCLFLVRIALQSNHVTDLCLLESASQIVGMDKYEQLRQSCVILCNHFCTMYVITLYHTFERYAEDANNAHVNNAASYPKQAVDIITGTGKMRT